MNSTQVQNKVNMFARKRGWRAHKWERPSRRGANDYFYTKIPRQIIFIEYKNEGEPPSVLQKIEIKRLLAEGHEVHVVDAPEIGYGIFSGR